MNCPHCHLPIAPELILKARQSEIAKRPRGSHPRPGANGLVRNGCTHHAVSSTATEGNICFECKKALRWDTKVGKWRILYAPKQKRPAE